MIVILFLGATPVLADATIGGKTVECYCTDRDGSRVELGEMTCIRVDGRAYMAQCQMSLNVPMWREISDGCLSSSLSEKLKPAVDAGGVDAHI
nr:hypothetical protein [Roseovarius litorisediminis]